MKPYISIAIIAGTLLLAGSAIYNQYTSENVTFTVTRTERITEEIAGHLVGRYLIFTENETFECTDAPQFGKFNSSDIYAVLFAGYTYSAVVCGWRVPFFDQYRNIISVERINNHSH